MVRNVPLAGLCQHSWLWPLPASCGEQLYPTRIQDIPHSGFLFCELEEHSAPSLTCHKPTGHGIPLASGQVGTKQEAVACVLLVSVPMVITGDGGQE